MIKAWHWLKDDGLTQFEPRQKVVIGEWLAVDPERLECCEYGLHASERIIDSLQYAPGALLCRVELDGKVLRQSDKLCAERRRIIAMADATNMLHEFACRQAESVIHLIDEQNRAIARRAIDTKRAWMAGKATNEELGAARAAAAWDAAWDAAWAAAAGDAARAAAWDAANTALTAMALELLQLTEAA